MAVRELVMSAAGANDAIPDTFTFSDANDVNINSTPQTSYTPVGYDSTTWTVSSGAQGSIDNINWASAGTIKKGQTFYIKGSASSQYSTSITYTATFGTVLNVTYRITTRPANLNPAAFTFGTSSPLANLGTLTTSGAVELTGMDPNQTVRLAVSGLAGAEIDAGTTSATFSGVWSSTYKDVVIGTGGSVFAKVRGTSSSSYDTSLTATVTANNAVSGSYIIKTKLAPSPTFTISDILNDQTIQKSSTVTSALVTITGYDTNQPITVSASGGSIDAGATSSLSGTFGASKTFNATSGTVYLKAQVTSSATFGGQVDCVVTVNGSTDTFSVKTRNAVTSPSAFNFTDVLAATAGSQQTASVVPSGYDSAAWSVSGGTGSIDGTTFFATGNITSGQTFYIRRNAGAAGTQVSATATIGTTSDTWYITSSVDQTPSTTFAFTSYSGREKSTPYNYVTLSGSSLTIGGLEPSYTFRIFATIPAGSSGTTPQVAAATFGSALSAYSTYVDVTSDSSGRIIVSPQFTTVGTLSTTSSVRITIGKPSDGTTAPTSGVSTADWSLTTRDPVTTASFSFTPVSTTTLSSPTTSALVTVTGLEPSYTFNWSTSGSTGQQAAVATYPTIPSAFGTTGSATTDSSGRLYVYAKVTSSSTYDSSTSVNVTIGSSTQTFTVTTTGDYTSDTQSPAFPSVTAAEPGSVQSSGTITLSGFSPNYTLEAAVFTTGSQLDAGTSTLSGTYVGIWPATKSVKTSASGTIVFAMKMTASSTLGQTIVDNIGLRPPGSTGSYQSGTASWSVKTRAAKLTPTPAMSFTPVNGAAVSTTTTSATILVQGLEANYGVTVSCSGSTGAKFDAGTSGLSGTFQSTSKTVTTSATGTMYVAAQVTSAAGSNQSTTCTVTVGSGSATFTVTTGGFQLFTSSGTFTVPTGVTSVCALCIGGGGGGGARTGGGGGGLGYKNNIAVTSGANYTVVVGTGGSAYVGVGANVAATAGGDSYFISAATVKGGGGGAGTGYTLDGAPTYSIGGAGGSYVGDAGGSGGAGGGYSYSSGNYYGGGGGSGGYSGAGGRGGDRSVAATAGAGGAGGGGYYVFNVSSGGGGGGTGVSGTGSNGAAGTSSSVGGGGGSSGTSGSTSGGGSYGGGGGGGMNAGAAGAVRIIWGTGRSYPSNAS